MKTRLRASLGVALIVAVATPAFGQPPRDAQRPAATGTASITGVVTSDGAQRRPLRRARVTVTGSGLPIGRTAITGDNGAFQFDRLAAGSYTLVAVKEAYVPISHGASRPNTPGARIVLRDGETRQVTLRMPRGGVITGTVTGADGQPVPGVNVMAMVNRYNPALGERRLAPGALSTFGITLGVSGTTDDRGAYRLFGLAPGDYVVGATVHTLPTVGTFRVLSDAEIRRALADVRETAPRRQPGTAPPAAPSTATSEPPRRVTYSRVFFPGTTIAAQATTITLGSGEERAGIDIPLQYVPTARVDGIVSGNTSVQPASIRLIPTQPGVESGGRPGTMANPDGTFAIPNVPPGHYSVVAQAMVRPATPGATPSFLTASADIHVAGEDIGNVVLSLQPGVTLSGRVAFEGAEPPAVDFTKLRINVPLSLTSVGMPAVLGPLQLDAAGRFTIGSVAPGVYRISSAIQGVRTPLGKWWIKSIAVDGRELLDRPFEIRQASDNLIVSFSDRASTLSGAARHAEGTPAAGAYVVAFSTDSATWFLHSRHVAGVRVGTDGTYSIRNLPAGEYFVIATSEVAPNEWFDPQLLQRLAATAQRITLAQDERRNHDLVIR